MNVKKSLFTADRKPLLVWCLSAVFFFFLAVSTAKAADDQTWVVTLDVDVKEFLNRDVLRRVIEKEASDKKQQSCDCEQIIAAQKKYFKNDVLTDEEMKFKWRISAAISEAVNKMEDSGQIPENFSWGRFYNMRTACGL